MKLPFVTLDVFTGTCFTGNPLAVVFDADALETAAMQAIAREFSHPETVFVRRPADKANAAALRIFTPAAELPFAGHPTVGAAVAIARARGGKREFALEEKIGPVTCKVGALAGDRGRAEFALPKLPQIERQAASKGDIANAIGLEPGDIGFGDFAPGIWSAGNAFTFVPVGSIDAVRRCRADLARWDAAFESGGRSAAFVFCAQTIEPTSAFHARMFAPKLGVIEDPATGSAVAAFAGLYAETARPADGTHRVTIEQGYEMGRPSLIELALTMQNGKLSAATIGGNAVIVTEGAIEA
jgi:trans-2,3-dihydro-3-hydroxyanthranilate isomerase